MTHKSTEQIERSRKRIAKCLNLLEAVHGELEFVFEQNPDWTPDIKWQIEEVVCKLGFSLATLSNWYDNEEELKQELVRSDNRWHISKTQKGEKWSKFFLTNYDLLLTPHGSGPDYKVCFETFIENCDQNIEKIRKIQQEAREHMTVLLEDI